MALLNLGILAHIDAGKTSLTERLLYAAGVIAEIGSVDAGSTQTDGLALERQRGITIKSAVVSFAIGTTTVNLIDTPGHPDFIAEVERVLGVLDGAVLVVSAVEGVQAQTLILFRTLQRLGIPTLIFVNKIDRRGAAAEATVADIARRLSPAVVTLNSVSDIGTRSASTAPSADPRLAEVLAERSDATLAAYVEDKTDADRLAVELQRQTRRGWVHPVLFGSAITGAGIEQLQAAITTFLPTASDTEGSLAATVFKIERGPAGEKLAYVRMQRGCLAVRDQVTLRGRPNRVTGLQVFANGTRESRTNVRAGEISLVRGLTDVRIGDHLGPDDDDRITGQFAPPSLETVVVPRAAADKGRMQSALADLAEQDPLINLRQDDRRNEVSVSLYGEVQKEVIGATLADEYGVAVDFRETTTICIERIVGVGAAAQLIGVAPNPYLATVGLRVAPAPPGTGVTYGLDVELGSMPAAFMTAVEQTVRQTLAEGPHGWAVPDCAVTLTHSGYWARQSHAHGTFDKSMSSTAGDFRYLTPLVLMAALRRAGTEVCEPIHRFALEIPADVFSPVLAALSGLRAVPRSSVPDGDVITVRGDIPAAQVHRLQQTVPGLTRGEGVLETEFARYAPVIGPAPERSRTDHDPRDWDGYVRVVTR